METTLAILMVLGMFIGIPAVVGLTIARAYIWKDHQVRRAGRAKGVEEAETGVKELAKEKILTA